MEIKFKSIVRAHFVVANSILVMPDAENIDLFQNINNFKNNA